MRSLVAILALVSVSTGCATALSDAMHHEVGAGIGGAFGDQFASEDETTLILGDSVAWTADYAFRVCQRCESFRLFIDLPLIVGGTQNVDVSGAAIPSQRRETYFVPNARFSIGLTEETAVFVGGGGGIGYFTDRERLTAGNGSTNVRSSTRAVGGFNAGFEAQLTELMAIRWTLWVTGPRAPLSSRPLVSTCERACVYAPFFMFFSTVFQF